MPKESIREDLRATAYAVDCRSDQSSLPKALLYVYAHISIFKESRLNQSPSPSLTENSLLFGFGKRENPARTGGAEWVLFFQRKIVNNQVGLKLIRISQPLLLISKDRIELCEELKLVSNNRSHFYDCEENVKQATLDFLRFLFCSFFDSIYSGPLTLQIKIRMADTFQPVVLLADYHDSI